jgi:hypothetical protein
LGNWENRRKQMGPRIITMKEAQRRWDNMTPEDVYGPEDEDEEDEATDDSADDCDDDTCTVRIGK